MPNFLSSKGLSYFYEKYIKVLKTRIDEMQKIPEGGTSADAALNDIKVGWDGTDFDTPGDAVRTQIERIIPDYDRLYNWFLLHGYHISKNITDIRSFTNTSTESLKYITIYKPISAAGLIFKSNWKGQRNVTVYPEEGDAYTIKISGGFPFVSLDGVNRVAIWINTNNDTISEIEVHIVTKRFIDLDDKEYVITDEFNPDESELEAEGFHQVYGNLMRSNMIAVAPGDEICVDSGYGYNGTLFVRLYFPYYHKDATDGETKRISYDSTTIVPNSKGLVIPEPCGYVTVAYLSNDDIKIYRKRKKKGRELQTIDFLGDSITAGYLTSSNYNNDYAYPRWLNERLCFGTVHNYGVGGTTISPREGYTSSFLERINSIISTEENIHRRILFILGGINDYSRQVPVGNEDSPEINLDALNYAQITFYKSYEKLLSICLEAYRGRVYCATPLRRRDSESQDDFEYSQEQYADVIEKLCKKYCVPCLRLDKMSSLNPDIDSVNSQYFTDGLHPNQWGQACVLAPMVANFIQTYAYTTYSDMFLSNSVESETV